MFFFLEMRMRFRPIPEFNDLVVSKNIEYQVHLKLIVD